VQRDLDWRARVKTLANDYRVLQKSWRGGRFVGDREEEVSAADRRRARTLLAAKGNVALLERLDS
jgi:hypothetical protein